MRTPLAAAALAAIALTGCSSGKSNTSAEQPPTQTGPAKVQETKVNVVEGLGRKGGFNASGIYQQLSPGVVTIQSDFGSLKTGSAALGSGFVLDSQGDIATNAHVVLGDPPKLQRANGVYVQFSDGNRVPAKIVGTDLNADVALLKVQPGGLTLTPLPLGTSSNLVVGSPVAAIGSPFGENQSLSVGVISATGRDIQSLTAFRIGNAIQTDAAINHGNSGGPLINSKGQVIGINSQIESSGGGGEGVGFAVPVDTVRRSIDQLKRTGTVNYAYLGVSTQELYPQLAQRLGLAAQHGAIVATVQAGGPAAKAGLEAGKQKITFEGQRNIPAGGDVIVSVDGRQLTRSADLTNVIGLKEPGQKVVLGVVRGKQRRNVTVTLGSRPDKPAPAGG